ncbi:hypothetical protein IE53DRAFT_190343 [Violaceomyces palustris]|uniref:Uncharacterized protein n=1 Tax=Violaceomyces palustris TaxID=1673888 RepID=A0ACD0P5K5_9BASI|nr:hypothetical protein IE53DRAFT_190343 [Violaceomyces palustris]
MRSKYHAGLTTQPRLKPVASPSYSSFIFLSYPFPPSPSPSPSPSPFFHFPSSSSILLHPPPYFLFILLLIAYRSLPTNSSQAIMYLDDERIGGPYLPGGVE